MECGLNDRHVPLVAMRYTRRSCCVVVFGWPSIIAGVAETICHKCEVMSINLTQVGGAAKKT